MIEKMEDRIGNPESSLDRETQSISTNDRVRDLFPDGFRVIFSILQTSLFFVLLFVIGILAIPLAILASQIENLLNPDRE